MKYDAILNDISEDILFITDIEGNIIHGNRTAQNILGLNKGLLKIAKIFADDQSNLLLYHIDESIHRQQEENITIMLFSRYYQAKIYPLAKQAAISMRDETATKRLSQRLSEMMQRLTFASQIAKIGYWELDLKNRKISWSSEMFRIFDINEKETSTKKNIIRERMHKEDWLRYKATLKQILKTGHPAEGIIRIIKSDNSTLYCRYKAEYLNYDYYNRKIVGIFQDLTEFLQIQHTLEAAKEAAEELNQEKSYLLAQASHDLQQPVSAMSLFIDNLLKADLSGRQQILVGKIQDSAQSLHQLLNNLLDISKLEANVVKVKKHKFNLEDIIKKIASETSLIMRDKKIKLHIVNCNQKMDTDSFLIERILRNYVSNAVKYTKNKILIGCLKYKKKIRILVLDNGKGIALDEQKQIFEPYYQSAKHQANRKQGTGLGLTIVKKTAELLGAEVGVLSKENKGSCFYLEFPIKSQKYSSK